MNVLVSLVLVGGLFLLGWAGAAAGMGWVFGAVLPYAALVLFFGGLILRVLRWASIPVPFRIPTTCGQQKSLAWIAPQRWENPHNGLAAAGRMLLEVLFFRSLLRNTRTQMTGDRRLVYATDLSLWLGAMAMHWAFLIVVIRHLRLLTNPVPWFVTWVEHVDGFLEIGGLPLVYMTTVLFILGAGYLLIRRLTNPQVRYLSLIGDYFPLFLLLGIGLSGAALRHLFKTDTAGVKDLAIGLMSFRPVVPDSLSPLFYGHLFLVTVLLAYFPFSKLVHMPGVFLSPTRNLANSNRAVRHINAWDYDVKVHPYDEYEDEFRDKMKAAGVPVERP